MFDLSIVIPCYNEELYIHQLITDIRCWSSDNKLNTEIIVGDNCSVDDSHKIAVEAGADKVVTVLNKGYGNVITEASQHASSDLLIFMDGDGQHKVKDLNAIYSSLKSGADLVIGNRFSNNKRTHSTSFLKEFIGNPVLTGIGKFLFNSKIQDFHSGFRGVKKSVFMSLKLKSSAFEMCSEMIAIAEIHKYKVVQVPISVSQPFLGRKSNIRPIIDGFKHLKSLINIAITNKKYGRLLSFLLLINSLMLFPIVAVEGPIIASDTVTYEKWSALLMNYGLNGIVSDTDYVFSKIFYLIHLYFVAFCKIIAGDYWTYFHFTSNVFFHLLTGILVFYNSYKLTKDGAVALFSNILFYFSIDSIKITCLLLSDTNFIFLINLLFAAYLSRSWLKKYALPGFMTVLLLIVFYRPTGVNVLGTIVFFFLLSGTKFKGSKITVFSFLGAIGVLLFAYNTYVLSKGLTYIDNMPLKFLRKKFEYDYNGVVVWDRYTVTKVFVNNPFESLLFYSQKLLRFFQFYVSQYNYLHNILNFMFFIPAYFATIFAVWSKRINKPEALFIIFFIFVTAFFHTFTVIDFDWRYRLVLVPFFCNLFAISLQSILSRYD